ncbi:MAG: hypothetical protein KatS3mg115_0193 [Candidatus Poribacteria bacterium]|nr:MAG: hypothetical protein KatS3mg115_0193 [Candidatus Poribacteria bacterium]
MERFDPERGVPFGSYAAWWVHQAIGQALARNARTVRLPAYLIQWQRRLHRLQEESERPLEAEELARLAGLSEEQVQRALQAEWEMIPLDAAPETLGGRSLREWIEDPSHPCPEEGAELSERNALLQAALEQLDPRSAQVLRLRYGLEDGVERSLKEVGDLLCLSKERIRQIERAAFQKLRRSAPGRLLGDYLQN